MNSVRIKIDSQAYGGYGVGRHEGRVLFVKDTVQGDEVDVVLEDVKKNFAFASVVSYVKKSSLRIDSDCPYDKTCGGCQWLSIPYESQLAFKEQFLVDALKRIGQITLENKAKLHSTDPRYYRNRILLRGTIHEKGSVQVGFMEESTHNQVPIKHCLNVHPHINSFIEKISSHITRSPAQKFRLEVQVLPALEKSEKSLLLVLHSLQGIGSLKDLKKELEKDAHWIGFSTELKDAPLFLFEEDLERKFYTTAGAFQQVHVDLNHKVRRLIKDFVELNKLNSVLDLFCGSGNLSLALDAKVEGVEQSFPSIRIAQENIRINQLASHKYLCIASHKHLEKLVREKKTFDLIVADPPRKGMKECLFFIQELKPKFMIYMSCDPMTLARDLKELKSSYEIIQTHLFDFFPNTFHLESVVFLKLKK